MVFVQDLQLEMPDLFPAEEFAQYMAKARLVLLPNKTQAWSEFAGASNLIGWRFRSSWEALRGYVESWRKTGADVSFEELYLRERALFGMFTAGVSCIESACYATYALASDRSLLALPFGEEEQRRCGPARLRSAVGSSIRSKELAQALDCLSAADDWRLWVEFRNRMTHRSNLPRIIRGAIGGAPPPSKAIEFAATSSTRAFEADAENLEALFAWLSTALKGLLLGGTALAAPSG